MRTGISKPPPCFGDYFQFDDALRLLAEGRQKLSDPTLYAYQAGAIYENKGDDDRAVEEYIKGALETGGLEPKALLPRARACSNSPAGLPCGR